MRRIHAQGSPFEPFAVDIDGHLLSEIGRREGEERDRDEEKEKNECDPLLHFSVAGEGAVAHSIAPT